MAKTKLFHVQETILKANGFTKEVIDDKDGPLDAVGSLRLEYFTKRINEELTVEVNYSYLTKDEKNYTLYSSSVEIHIDDEWCVIPVSKLSDLLNLIRILHGDE